MVWDGGVRVDQALGRRWTANITRKASGTQVGHRVGIYFGGARIFGGTVQEVTHETPLGVSQAFTRYRLACTSWETRLDSKYPDEAVYGQVFYADAGTDALSSQYHGKSDGQKIRFTTSGTLPAGISPATTYFVRDATTHTFKVAATLGGSAIDITDAGTGTHRFQWLAKDVALDLIGRFASGEGIDTGSGDIDEGDFLDQIIIAHNSGVSVAAALDSIAETCGFIWYLDPDLALHFKARSTTPAAWNISNSNIQSVGFNYRKTRQEYQNRVVIVGGWPGLVPTEETFAGDGVTAQWWLTHRAEIIEGVTLDGEPATVGTDGIETGVGFYWNPGERNLRADAAPAAGQSVVVRYRELGGNAYVVEDTAEQTARAAVEGGTGIYTRVYDDTSNVDALGSVAKAQAALDEYKTMAEEINYSANVDSAANLLQVGQLQTIAITSQGINSNYLLDQISIAALSRTSLMLNVRALGGTRLADWIDYFKKQKRGASGSLGTIRGSGGSGGSGVAAYRASEVLTGNVANYAGPVATPPEGSIFYLRITQGAGPYTWTWDSAVFAAGTPTNITDEDGHTTAITFIAESDNKWHVQSWF